MVDEYEVVHSHVSKSLFVSPELHSKLHGITLVATKVHMILQSFVVSTCMRDDRELV